MKPSSIAPIQQKPNSSIRFTGRNHILDKLKIYFFPRTASEQNTRRIFVLHGMGGIGKTQICLKFSEEVADRCVDRIFIYSPPSDIFKFESSFSHIFWIDASSVETISDCLRGICHVPAAQVFGLVEESPESALQWLGSLKSEFLMVFNNADAINPEELENVLPPGKSVNILITTRNPELGTLTLAENSVCVDEMEEDDAISLLLRACSLEISDEGLRDSAKNIVNELCKHPLAIDQAGAFIRSGAYDLDWYLSLYKENHAQLLSSSSFKGTSRYNRSLYGTWELSLKVIKDKANTGGPDAKEAQTALLILNIFAFCHYEKIPQDIFQNAANESDRHDVQSEESRNMPLAIAQLEYRLLQLNSMGNWDEYSFRKGIETLLKLSLITKDSLPGVYSVHRLVHSWIRETMSKEDKETYWKIAHNILSCSISCRNNSVDYKFYQMLLTHLLANSDYRLQVNIDDILYDDAYVRFVMVLDKCGDCDEAEKFQVKVLERRQNHLGNESLDTVSARGYLAMISLRKGKYKEAEKNIVQVLKARQKILGKDHLDTIQAMEGLAILRDSLGEYDEAEDLQLKVLDVRNRVLGDNHQDTMQAMANLANTHLLKEQYKEAEKLQKRILKTQKRILGDDHPATLLNLQDLANIYCKMGQYKKAEELQMQVLNMKKNNLGDEHPDTIQIMGHLASTYYERGHYKEAEKLQKQVLKLQKKNLGENHLDTIWVTETLGLTYYKLGKYKAAEDLQVKVLFARKEILKDEHPAVIQAVGYLTSTYCQGGRYKEAEVLNTQVLAAAKRSLPEDHSGIIGAMGALASTYRLNGKYKEAKELEVHVLDARKKFLGHQHPDTIKAVENLGLTCFEQEYYKEAERLITHVIFSRKQILGNDHPDTVSALEYCAKIHYKQGKYIQAINLQNQVFDARKVNLGDEHPDTIRSLAHIASNYYKQGHYGKAQEMQKQVLAKQTDILGGNHPDTIGTMRALAHSLNAQDDKDEEALEILQEAFQLYEKTIGPSHPHTIDSHAELAAWKTHRGLSKFASTAGHIF